MEAVRVLAETMGLNYSIDPKVKGNGQRSGFRQIGRKRTPVHHGYLLNINGATMIKGNDGVYRIVPWIGRGPGMPVYTRSGAARHEGPGGLPGAERRQGDGGGVEAAALPRRQHREAAHNALILVDNPANMDKLLEID